MFVCTLCPRRCAAPRDDTHGEGYCALPATAYVAHTMLHTGEEPCFGTAGAVFFSGCTLRCAYCQNHAISRTAAGQPTDADTLAQIFEQLVTDGADVLDLVSATPYVPTVVQALRRYRPPVPVVYNCGGYERIETLRMLDGLVDVYLPDYKYDLPDLAAALSDAPDYPQTARAAIREMVRQTGPWQQNARGIVTRGTLVRHLVLPLHTRDSIAALDTLADIPNIRISLMSQYTPVREIDGFPELSRRITTREYEKVTAHLIERGLTDGYVQDRASATTAYIPDF